MTHPILRLALLSLLAVLADASALAEDTGTPEFLPLESGPAPSFEVTVLPDAGGGKHVRILIFVLNHAARPLVLRPSEFLLLNGPFATVGSGDGAGVWIEVPPGGTTGVRVDFAVTPVEFTRGVLVWHGGPRRFELVPHGTAFRPWLPGAASLWTWSLTHGHGLVWQRWMPPWEDLAPYLGKLAATLESSGEEPFLAMVLLRRAGVKVDPASFELTVAGVRYRPCPLPAMPWPGLADHADEPGSAAGLLCFRIREVDRLADLDQAALEYVFPAGTPGVPSVRVEDFAERLVRSWQGQEPSHAGGCLPGPFWPPFPRIGIRR